MYLRGEGPLPDELAFALQCERYQCLLVEGGLLDQPSWLFTTMDFAMLKYEQHRRKQREEELIEAEAERLLRETLKNAAKNPKIQ